MELIGYKESDYLRKNFSQVKHVTLNPNGPGVVRIHMIPPKFSFNKTVPSVIILNGQDILPISLSWTILLSSFIDEVVKYEDKNIAENEWESIVDNTIIRVQKVYKKISVQELKSDLWRIINTLTDIATGKKPEENIGILSIGAYAKNMRAPHRMDLMISSMKKNGDWNCNQRCIHCYAAGQKMSEVQELPTESWKKIIDKCREACIPQLTFTGGEPTLRSDLVELVAYSKWFVTRLNTNGVCLTSSICEQLFQASLDSVQVTLYSDKPEIHTALVGANNWEKTVEGIKNAIHAHLSVSVNTPLCTINRGYTDTLRLLNRLGVKFVTCSGLIVTGNAKSEESVNTQLSENELYFILQEAFEYCKESGMEISFTSPGWLSENKLRDIGFTSIPSCGACLSNMAIAPDGNVIPCQSWLSDETLGKLLFEPWKNIWNNKKCKSIRVISIKMEQKCQLRSTSSPQQKEGM